MFSICRQTHPATGIEHAVSCCFYNNDDVCLVTAGANIVKVFRMVPEGHTKEVNAGMFCTIFYCFIRSTMFIMNRVVVFLHC